MPDPNKNEPGEALSEVKRLAALDDTQTASAAALIGAMNLPVKNGLVISTALYDLLASLNTPAIFFEQEKGVKSVNGHLYQFLVIHFSLGEEQVVFSTTGDLCIYLRENKTFRQPFMHWADRSKVIIYLENTGRETWQHFAENFDGELPGMHLLGGSLPYCAVRLDDIFRVIRAVKNRHPDQSSYRFMAPDILKKLEGGSELRAEILNSADKILSEPVVREMMPVFLKGAVNGDEQTFAAQLIELPGKIAQTMLADTLFALAVACLETPYCLAFFKQNLDQKRDEQLIQPAEYLHILNIKNFMSPTVLAYMEGRSLVGDVHELGFIVTYLSNNLEEYFKEAWFVRIAGNVIRSPAAELKGGLNHLLAMLVEKDTLLVYQLLTLRFSIMAETSFLDDPWHGLVAAGTALFEHRLTLWFIHGNSNVHRTLQHLCTADLVSAQHFRFSQEVLASLDVYQKIYIGYKVTGYIYSKEYLESALFSLAKSTVAVDDLLLDELYAIFDEYLIYNYRSTLKSIKTLIAGGSLPAHLLSLYNRLIVSYDEYFAGLDQVKPLVELRPDPELLEHGRFFRQQKMAAEFREAQKTGLSSLFKTTTVKGHRWAIRRPGQQKNDPQEMALFRTEAEFPAGEILNPVANEKMRVSYRQVKLS